MTEETLKTIEGRIATFNPEKRGIAIRDNNGITTGCIWDPARDKEFMRLQAGWSARITLEKRGDQWVAIAQAKGPRLPGRKKEEPLPDQRMIMKSVLIKAWSNLWMATNTPDIISFKDARKDILDAVDEDLLRVMGDQA